MTKTKRVLVAALFIYEMDVMEDFDKDNIEFMLNESCSCADNRLVEISEYIKDPKNSYVCACPIHKGFVLTLDPSKFEFFKNRVDEVTIDLPKEL